MPVGEPMNSKILLCNKNLNYHAYIEKNDATAKNWYRGRKLLNKQICSFIIDNSLY